MTIAEVHFKLNEIETELNKVLIGQEEVVENILTALFSGGHVLLEGLPGLGKTLLANSLAYVMEGDFKRIQFTPDLMPSDIIGTTIYNTQNNQFQIKKGPVFTNLLLADEINRSPAKTQSALLQAMQERKVSIDGTDYDLGGFFICIATQNPIEMEGTYPLPEAQVDRFLMKLHIGYPDIEEERKILYSYRDGFTSDKPESAGLKQVISQNEFNEMREVIKNIRVDDKIIHYITEIVTSTRNFSGIEVGCSPRGSVSLFQASKVKAVFNERDFVIPDDVKDIVYPVLRHRIILEAEAEIEGAVADDFLKRIIESIEVPR